MSFIFRGTTTEVMVGVSSEIVNLISKGLVTDKEEDDDNDNDTTTPTSTTKRNTSKTHRLARPPYLTL